MEISPITPPPKSGLCKGCIEKLAHETIHEQQINRLTPDEGTQFRCIACDSPYPPPPILECPWAYPLLVELIHRSVNGLEGYLDHLAELCTIAGVGMHLGASIDQGTDAREYGTLCPDLEVDPEGRSLFDAFSHVGRLQIFHPGEAWLTTGKDRMRASVLAKKCLELLTMRKSHSKVISEIDTLHRKIVKQKQRLRTAVLHRPGCNMTADEARICRRIARLMRDESDATEEAESLNARLSVIQRDLERLRHALEQPNPHRLIA